MARAHAAVRVVTTHRMAGSALAEYLGYSLRQPVTVCAPGDALSARVAVLVPMQHTSETVPRMLRELRGTALRVVLVYDGARPSAELVVAAHRIGVASTFDLRGEPRVLADQVRYAIDGRPWAQDWAGEGWAQLLEHEREGLTLRERQVIEALYAGPDVSVDDVAGRLGLSVNTVRVHIANVRRKLQGRHTGNRAALQAALTDAGWLG